jgi:outer membrane protein assembly factor BamD
MSKKFLVVLAALLLFFGCGGPKHTELDPNKQNDKELYETGEREMKDENYDKARAAYKLVFDNFPKSDYRILAKLNYAESFYKQGGDANYILAIQEYQDFITLFPFSPKAAYAQYQIGACYYQMMEKPDRDQSNTRKALDEFRKVIDGYPNGEYYKSAYDRLIECYGRLAEHEFLIARFYNRTGRHIAAVERLKELLKKYPESVHTAEQYYYLAHSLEELSQAPESCVYYQKILEKWPDSEFSGDAREGATRVCAGAPQTQPAQTEPSQTQPAQTQPSN